MKKYYAHLKYTLIHKYYVFLACRYLKVNLLTAIVHDWSKFTPIEFGPYARYYFDENGDKKSDGDNDKTEKEIIEFRIAWLHHQKVNKHHWQAWLSIGLNGIIKTIEIPDKYLYEMVADWLGASAAKNKLFKNSLTLREWYNQNIGKIVINNKSKEKLAKIIDSIPDNFIELI